MRRDSGQLRYEALGLLLPLDRDHCLTPLVTLSASQPINQIGDPGIRREPQPMREAARGDHAIMPADALDADKIARPKIAHPGRV